MAASSRPNTLQLHYLPSSPRLSAAEVLLFMVPALQFWQVMWVGRLFITDLLLLALFLIVLPLEGGRLAAPLPRRFIALGLLWLGGQMLTDLIRHTSFDDYSRGWMKIGLTITHFSVLYLLAHGRRRRILAYALGLVAGGFLAFCFAPSEFASSEPWKFGLAGPVTLAVFLLVTMANLGGVVAAAAGLVMAALNVLLGFRSLGGICLLASAYLLIQLLWARRKRQGRRLRLRRVVFIASALGLASWGLLTAYELAAGEGVLGQEASRKYEAQSAGKYGIMLGGRGEILASLRAIGDSPFLGHGSWAKDPYYALAHRQWAAEQGYSTAALPTSDLIPTHSYLFGAWVEAGLAGALFWAWMLFLNLSVLRDLYRAREKLSPLIAYFTLFLMWDVLFSPYGAQERFQITFYATVLMSFLSSRQGLQLPAKARPAMWPPGLFSLRRRRGADGGLPRARIQGMAV